MARRESAEVCCSGAERVSQLLALRMHCGQLLVAVLLHEAARGSQPEVGSARQQSLLEPLVTHEPEQQNQRNSAESMIKSDRQPNICKLVSTQWVIKTVQSGRECTQGGTQASRCLAMQEMQVAIHQHQLQWLESSIAQPDCIFSKSRSGTHSVEYLCV